MANLYERIISYSILRLCNDCSNSTQVSRFALNSCAAGSSGPLRNISQSMKTNLYPPACSLCDRIMNEDLYLLLCDKMQPENGSILGTDTEWFPPFRKKALPSFPNITQSKDALVNETIVIIVYIQFCSIY